MTTSLTLATVGLTLVAVAGAVRRLPARARADAWMFLGFVGAPAIALVAILSASRPDTMDAGVVQEQAAQSPLPSTSMNNTVPASWTSTTDAPAAPRIRTAQSRQPAPRMSRPFPGAEAP
jgi:hypothetical protein